MKITTRWGFITLTLFGLLLAGCETTKLTTDWTNEEVGQISFSKVLVIGISPMESLRPKVEDNIVAQIDHVEAIPSYEFLPEVEDQVDPEKVKAVIKAEGFDGIVTMRMLGMHDETTHHEGYYRPEYYGSFYSYYSPAYALSPYYMGMPGAYGMPMTYEYVPPRTTRDVFMNIETNIYDARTGDLIWYGRTQTKNADQRQQTIPEVAKVIKARLRSVGLTK
jgi:hypothetical protein